MERRSGSFVAAVAVAGVLVIVACGEVSNMQGRDADPGEDARGGDSGPDVDAGDGACGNQACDPGETCASCPDDCGRCDLAGEDLTAGSVLEAARMLVAAAPSPPTAGGMLSIDLQPLGGYDFRILDEPVVVDSFEASEWFTATEDSRSAWIAVDGDLTIPGDVVFVPPTRKLFTVLYVSGDLVIDGELSVSARGANHSVETGSGIAAAAIRIASGTFSGVVNPSVPAAGAAGAASAEGNEVGNAGDAGTDGRTGGGGSGAAAHGTDGSAISGAGAPGTSFSGGAGGGGRRSNFSAMGEAEGGFPDGGRGGSASLGGTATTTCAGGGAGNPGGAGADSDETGAPGSPGTGGVLIVIVEGTYSGAGRVTAAGADGGAGCDRSASGGGSGGGSITILAGVDEGPVPAAPGGRGGASNIPGGDGGDGTARVLLFAE